ncbi:MAG: hypothetical protein GTO64_08745 [Candidatus Latescibacteria bacterium]|nr:hypothetical protein [Candidatus Latescibacterota bacterium]
MNVRRILIARGMIVLTLILIFCVAGMFVFGCGGANTRHAAEKDKIEREKAIELTGTISVRGSAAAPIILLQVDDGIAYTVQTSQVGRELMRLEGMRVVVQGNARSPEGKGPTLLDVHTYRILPLDTGETPVVGWIKGSEGSCVLKEEDGTEWKLTGDLALVLMDFDGAKVWVVGERSETDPSSREIVVTGYGILAEVY